MSVDTVNSDSLPTNSEHSALLNELFDNSRKGHEARTLRKSILQHAKLSGLNIKAATIVESLLKGKPASARDFVQSIVRFAAVYGILEKEELQQLSLFDPTLSERALKDQALERARDAGYYAGINGLPEGDNPHPEGSEEAMEWNRCRQRGFDIVAEADGGDGTRAVANRKQPNGRRTKLSTTDDVGRVARPRGRPPGSKNKAKIDVPPPVQVEAPQLSA